MIARAVLALALALAACRTRTEAKPPAPEEDAMSKPHGGPAEAGADAAPVPPGAPGWIQEAEGEPASTERAIVFERIRAASHRAVVVHEETIEECSGLGGSHVFFAISDPGSGVVHFGGHGSQLASAFTKGEVWVVAFEPITPPVSVKNEGWCVPDRKIDGRAFALLPVASREEGRRVVER